MVQQHLHEAAPFACRSTGAVIRNSTHVDVLSRVLHATQTKASLLGIGLASITTAEAIVRISGAAEDGEAVTLGRCDKTSHPGVIRHLQIRWNLDKDSQDFLA